MRLSFSLLLVALVSVHGQLPPVASLESIVNAAAQSGPPQIGFYFAEGSIVSIYGRNLATREAVATQFPLPVELAGTRVLFSQGLAGRLLYVSPSQINMILPSVPNPMLGLGFLTIATPAGSLRVGQLSGVPLSPGVFAADGTGCGKPALWSYRLNNLVGPNESVQPGEILSLFGTGLGPPVPADGEPAPADPLLTVDPLYRQEVVFGSGAETGLLKAEVLWQGKTPGTAGVDQINFRVPEGAPEGCAVPFRVQNPRVGISVRSSQILSVAVSESGGVCQDKKRDGFLRLVLVREINSGMPSIPARRDRLWVDFLSAPPPALNRVILGTCGPTSVSGRFRGRVCPGLEGVSEDYVSDPIVFDSGHWEAKIPQDAGSITLAAGDRTARISPGLTNGLPFYPPELPAGFLQEGRVRVNGAGGAHIGPFEAELTLPPFAVTSNLAPGTVIGHVRFGIPALRWTGGSPNGLVRLWLSEGECRESATKGSAVPWAWPDPYFPREDGTLSLVAFMHSPHESEEVTITANGLKYGARLTYLYVYRFGGLRVTN